MVDREGRRTLNLSDANRVLSQLSYTPIRLAEDKGLEPLAVLPVTVFKTARPARRPIFLNLVRTEGLEPPCLAAQRSKRCASAISPCSDGLPGES